MIDERLDLPFFVQCDAQVVRQPDLVALLARAGCYQMFVGVESFDRRTLLAAQKNHNHPEHYGEIVRLCRENGIGSHFSNIIGFPGDTASAVLDQLRALRSLRPDLASFYILTPVPGTEQYEDFLAAGVITESNLDRFDGTCPTWQHPHLSAAELRDLLFRCYREFYSLPDALAKSLRWFWIKRRSPNILLKIATGAYSFLSRLAAAQHMHPMAGGMHQVRLDHVSDYIELRRRCYGFDLAPLPRGLQPSDQAQAAPLATRSSARAGAIA
jgi:hypothetical protein